MLLITKTIASLSLIEVSAGRISMMCQLKLAEIQSNLDSYIYDSLKTLNEIMPTINENGSKDLLLEANILMGKILMKMGVMDLSKSN